MARDSDLLGAATVMVFELWHLKTGTLIRGYQTEGAALAFIRDVLLFASREEVAQFRLRRTDTAERTTVLHEGEALLQRAIEDRVL